MFGERWELVAQVKDDRGSVDVTERLDVPGGWLYRNLLSGRTAPTTYVTVTFVPWAPRKGQG